MGIVKIVFAVLALAVVGVLVLAALKPDTFRVTRSISINAPPGKIFPLINDLRAFSTWSTYEKKDPDMKRTYSGPPNGKGARYAWEGNSEIGIGSLEIAESTQPSNVKMKLDFIKPFEAHNFADFTLVPEGGATSVTWSMSGPTPFIAKIMHVIFNMDRMVGDDFEAGLRNMKAIAET